MIFVDLSAGADGLLDAIDWLSTVAGAAFWGCAARDLFPSDRPGSQRALRNRLTPGQAPAPL